MALFTSKNKKKKDQEASHTEARLERMLLLTNNSDFYMREAYKMLRTNVTFSIIGEQHCRVIMVTSSLQSEGKSTTAANLAISYAQDSKKVLLIDCDLRRPKQNRLMNVSSSFGLSDYLVSNEPYQKAIQPTNVIGLDLLCSGSIPPNPSELLGSARMAKFISQLRQDYDYIILDAPPVNMVTDAVVLSDKSDGVIFVVSAGQSERGPVMHAVEQLQYAHARLLGFVLRGVELEKNRYGYGRYQKYGYRKGYGYSRHGYGYGYSRHGYGYGYGNSSSSGSSSSESQGESRTEKAEKAEAPEKKESPAAASAAPAPAPAAASPAVSSETAVSAAVSSAGAASASTGSRASGRQTSGGHYVGRRIAGTRPAPVRQPDPLPDPELLGNPEPLSEEEFSANRSEQE